MKKVVPSSILALVVLVLLSHSPNELSSVDAFSVSHRPNARGTYSSSVPLNVKPDDSLISSVDDIVAAANDAVREAEEALRNLPATAATSIDDVGARRDEISLLQNRIDDAEAEIARLASAETTYPKGNILTQFVNFRSDADVEAEKAKKRRIQLEQEVSRWKEQLAKAKEAFLDLEDEMEFASDPRKSSSSSEVEKQQQEIAMERAGLAEAELRAKEEEKLLKEKNERNLKAIKEVQSKLEASQTKFETKQAEVKNQLEEGNRKRSQKVDRMATRYQTIRSEISQLLKGSNRDNTEETIERLQTDLRELEIESNKVSLEREILAMEKSNLASNQVAVNDRITKALEKKEFENVQLIRDIAELQKREGVYKQEVAILQKELATELAAKESLETQAKEQRIVFQAEMAQWAEKNKKVEAELSSKVASIQLKYNLLRKEMIDILAREKNSARDQEHALVEKHKIDIEQKTEIIVSLEAALSTSQNENTVLRTMNADLTKQRDAALAAVDDLEAKASDQKLTISSLERDVASKEKKINRYEGSLREQLKLSIRLTKKRILNGAKASKKAVSSRVRKLKAK